MYMPCLIAWLPEKTDYVLMCVGHVQISSQANSEYSYVYHSNVFKARKQKVVERELFIY
jgi:hypothetical protein